MNASYHKIITKVLTELGKYAKVVSYDTIPTSSDDITYAYAIGSVWIYQNTFVYVCVENTTDNAVWIYVGTIEETGISPLPIDDGFDSTPVATTTFTDHTGNSNIHFYEGNIDHSDIQGIGIYNHNQIDTHIDSTFAHGITGNVVGTIDDQTLTNKTFVDNSTIIQNNTDNTKKVRFELGQLSTGTIRILSAPDADTTIAGTTNPQIISNKIIDASLNTLLNISNSSIKGLAGISATKIADGTIGNSEFQRLNGITSSVVGVSDSQTLSNKCLVDTTTCFQDNIDATKKARLELSGVTTSTTRILTIPDANTVLVGTDVPQTLTNKTIDVDNNTITNINNSTIKPTAAIDATKIADGTVSNAEFQQLSGLTSAVVGVSDTQTLTNKTLTDSTTYFQDNLDNTKRMQLEISSVATATTRILTIPDADITIVGTNTNQILTNKTLDSDLNTITNISNSDIRSAAAIDATKISDGTVSNAEFQQLNGITSSVAGVSDIQTLINKTIDASQNTISNIDNSTIKSAASIDAAKIADGTISNTEFQQLNGIASAVVGVSDTQTLTNKILDSDLNTISNIDDTAIKVGAGIDASKIADGSVSNANFQQLNGITSTVAGISDTQTLTNKTLVDNTTYFQDNLDNTKKLQLDISGITTTTTRTLMVPDSNTTIAGTDATQNLSNKTFIDDLNMNSNKITNLATPASSGDGATKGYVDQIAAGLSIKDSVDSASTVDLDSNSSISGTITYNSTAGTSGRGQITATLTISDTITVDRINYNSTNNGTRILLKNQPSGDQNGVWTVNISGTSLTLDRATDYDADTEVTSGTYNYIDRGTVHGNSGWVLNTSNPITIGGASGTSLTYAQFVKPADIIAGTGCSKTGNTLNVGGSSTIIANANTLDVNSSVTANQILLSSGSVGTASNFGKLPLDNSNSVSGTLGISNGGTNTSSFTAGIRIVATNSGNNALESTTIDPSTIVMETDTQTLTNKTLTDNVTTFQNNVDNTKNLQLQLSSITTATTRTLTIPDANTTIVGTDATQTLTNKSIDADNNTITNIDNTDIKASAAIDATKIADGTVSNTEFQQLSGITSASVGISDIQTLTNKTLTDNVTTFQDNTDNTKKLQFELSSITTATTRTIAIPDVNTTIVGTDATQTLTNKTIDADNNTITNIGNADIKVSAGIDATKIADGSINNSEFQQLNGIASAIVGISDIQILTNKTINADNNTISNIDNENIKSSAAIDATKIADGTVSNTEFQQLNGITSSVVGISDTQVLTNKTLDSTTNTIAADKLHSATTTVTVSGATAPTAGQVLTATSSIAANWQTPSSADVTVKDEGTNVTNTPHSGLNFVGAGVAVTDAGGGVARINISGSSSPFGSEFQTAESTITRSTTSGSWQQGQRLTTLSLPSGTYHIEIMAIHRFSSTSIGIRMRAQVNDSTTLWGGNEFRQTPPNSESYLRMPLSLTDYYTGSGVLNIDLDYSVGGSGGGETAYLYWTRITIWRVS